MLPYRRVNGVSFQYWIAATFSQHIGHQAVGRGARSGSGSPAATNIPKYRSRHWAAGSLPGPPMCAAFTDTATCRYFRTFVKPWTHQPYSSQSVANSGTFSYITTL